MRTIQSIDFGNNEKKAKDLFEKLLKDDERKPNLIQFFIDERRKDITWFVVYYITK